MSFIKKAQEAASQAAEAARITAAQANQKANDPATQEAVSRSAREAVGMARRGVTTVIEKIDPGTLAELIIKATYLQELTNRALRQKGSPYRIGEISISASIPPAVSFAIGRIGDDDEELVGQVVSSTELVAKETDDGELVLALDGTFVDEDTIPVGRADCRSAGRVTARRCATRRHATTRRGTVGLGDPALGRLEPAHQHRLDVLDRAGRPLAGRARGDLDPAGRERAW